MLQILCMSLLDLRPWREGSYELGSVHPSLRPSSSFLRIGSLVSGAIWWCVWQTRNFSEKSPLVENYQIWSKMTLKPGWMKGTRFINGFLKKKKSLIKKTKKIIKDFFYQLCTVKGVKKYMKTILIVFPIKFLFSASGPLWTWRWLILILDPL